MADESIAGDLEVVLSERNLTSLSKMIAITNAITKNVEQMNVTIER